MAAQGRKSQSNKILMMLSVIFIILLGQATRYENQGASNYWPLTLTLRLLLPATISIYGVTKRSLDSLGGTLALVVGVIHSVANCSFSYSMIAFFIFGSLLSKWKMNTKQLFEPIEDSGVTRNWSQVFCNGMVSSMASVAFILTTDHKTYTALVVLSSIACCCGDTFASEFGSVVAANPRLVTTLQHVPRGTNGGVSLGGTLASVVGGVVIGTVYYMTQQWTLSGDISITLILTTSTLGGVLGSLIDSLLGATLQYSGYDVKTGRISHTPSSDKNVKHVSGRNVLTNNQVNLLSSFLTGIMIPYLTLNII